MFRWALETGIRFFRRRLPSFKNGISAGARPVSTTVHNEIVPSVISAGQRPVVNFKNFFFAHWLSNASNVARFQFNPVQRMVANRRNPTPLFLALVGFTYIGGTDKEKPNSKVCSPTEEKLHNWLKNKLETVAKKIPEKSVDHSGKKCQDYKVNERLGKQSCNSAVYAAEADNDQFALKMLFNYDTSSQSSSLKKAFAKEFAVLSNLDKGKEGCQRYTTLPDHFNVMKILWCFADYMPKCYDAMESYPAALPSHVDPDHCYGRNRTMFLVMPKFSATLQDYLSRHKDNLDTRKSLILLTQLLEGVRHLSKNNVAHRDLKCDNILVNEGRNGLPHLVITDFGCCLAERDIGLVLPFETDETNRGGNPEFMAPEVSNAVPGRGQVIDYSKADEWAVGALAYEIFGQRHPFREQNRDKKSYCISDLPELRGAPKAVEILVKQLLQRHPNDRPHISLAATICQMLLWAPELCMVDDQGSAFLDVLKRWFEYTALRLTLEVSKYRVRHEVPVREQMLLTFLSRTSVEEIVKALEWLRSEM